MLTLPEWSQDSVEGRNSRVVLFLGNAGLTMKHEAPLQLRLPSFLKFRSEGCRIGLGADWVAKPYGFPGYKKSYTRRNFRGVEKTLSNKTPRARTSHSGPKGRWPKEIVGEDWKRPTVRGVLRPSPRRFGMPYPAINRSFRNGKKSATSEKIRYRFGNRPPPVSAK